jgi:hypothetical protein
VSFSATREVKAVRRARPCQHCLLTIEKGEPALVVSGVHEGHFYSDTMHHRCEAAGAEYFDIVCGCGDEYVWLHELENEDLEWLQVDHWIAIGYVRRAREFARMRRDAR